MGEIWQNLQKTGLDLEHVVQHYWFLHIIYSVDVIILWFLFKICSIYVMNIMAL